MNIAVGKISDEARAAIIAAGGRIEATLKANVLMAVLPDTAEEISNGPKHCWISLTEDAEVILHFTRGWESEDCSLDLCK